MHIFDVVTKALAIEIEGLEVGFRFDDLKALFESQANFSKTISGGQANSRDPRLSAQGVSRRRSPVLRNRSVVQSIITTAAQIVATGSEAGNKRPEFRKFVESFVAELSKQVELGLRATDHDYIAFQRSVNANVRAGAKTRNEILLRKMFRSSPTLASRLSILAWSPEPGLSGEIRRVGNLIDDLIQELNSIFQRKARQGSVQSNLKDGFSAKR